MLVAVVARGCCVVQGPLQSYACSARFGAMRVQVEPIARIEVMGKSADQVVEEVLQKLGTTSGGKAGKVGACLCSTRGKYLFC